MRNNYPKEKCIIVKYDISLMFSTWFFGGETKDKNTHTTRTQTMNEHQK